MSVQLAPSSSQLSKETLLELYKKNPLEALKRLSLLINLHYDINENAHDKNLISIIESYAEYLWNLVHENIDARAKLLAPVTLSDEDISRRLSNVDALLAGDENDCKWKGPLTWSPNTSAEFDGALIDLSQQIEGTRTPSAVPIIVSPVETNKSEPSLPIIVKHEVHDGPAVVIQNASQKFVEERQTSKQLRDWLKKSAPVIFGVASGAGLRMTSKFVIAAMLTTKPVAAIAACVVASPVAAGIVSIASAFVLGATIGGLVQIGKVKYWGSEEEKQGNWKRRAFNKGAIGGGVGALIGWGVSDVMQSGGHLHHLWNFIAHHSHHSAHAATLTAQQVTENAVHHATSVPDSAVPHNPVESVVAAAHGDSLVDIVDGKHLSSLSAHTQELLRNAHGTSSTLHACKEASYELINGTHHDPEGMKMAKNLIGHALTFADKNHIATGTVRQLHSDMAYMLSRGHGAVANKFGLLFDKEKAIGHAKLAKTVFSKQLLHFWSVPTQG